MNISEFCRRIQRQQIAGSKPLAGKLDALAKTEEEQESRPASQGVLQTEK